MAAYIEQHSGSAATIKQHMAAIRMMFSWLTEKGILAINPAREVKTPKFSRTEGKTPAFSTEEVQKVLASVDTSHVIGHRDKAFLATLAYTFARIGAVVNLNVEDYFQAGKRSLIRFKEKGGKEKEIPVHHKNWRRFWTNTSKSQGCEKSQRRRCFQRLLARVGSSDPDQ